jgi:hypothetical protein
MNPRSFRVECQRLMREVGLKFAIIDYFNLMRGNFHERERWREMQEVILALKEIAGELNIPILLLLANLTAKVPRTRRQRLPIYAIRARLKSIPAMSYCAGRSRDLRRPALTFTTIGKTSR